MDPVFTDRLTESLTDLRTVLILLLVLWRPWVICALAVVAGVLSGARLLTVLTPEETRRATP